MRKVDRSGLYTCPGSPISIKYAPVVGSDGSVTLKEVGKENTDEFINSFAESCDLRVILQRVANGEVDLLEKAKGTYGDFTGTPKTLAEFLQLQIDSSRLFSSLPLEVKKLFGNDPNQFLAQTGTDEWFEKLGSTLPEQMRSMNNTPPAQTEGDAQSSTTD